MQQKLWDARNPSSRLPGLTLHSMFIGTGRSTLLFLYDHRTYRIRNSEEKMWPNHLTKSHRHPVLLESTQKDIFFFVFIFLLTCSANHKLLSFSHKFEVSSKAKFKPVVLQSIILYHFTSQISSKSKFLLVASSFLSFVSFHLRALPTELRIL